MPHGSTLRPTAASLDLVSRLYDEYLPLFDSKTVNIGGDEPWELDWATVGAGATARANQGVPRLPESPADARKQEGASHSVWGRYRVEDPVLKQLSTDATAMIWGYEAGHPFEHQCALMAEANVQNCGCPGTSS